MSASLIGAGIVIGCDGTHGGGATGAALGVWDGSTTVPDTEQPPIRISNPQIADA